MTENGSCSVESFSPSSAESVGRFWFWESPQIVIQSNFHSLEGAKAVGSSGNHSDFVVEALHGAFGDFSFGPKHIQYQLLMGAQHSCLLFHRLLMASHVTYGPDYKHGDVTDMG